MSDIIKRTFKCTGCGEARPCYLTTNQEKGEIEFYDHTESLKCVLDETNQTSYNWEEMQANVVDKSTEQALPIRDVSNPVCPECGDLGWIYDETGTIRSTCPCHY